MAPFLRTEAAAPGALAVLAKVVSPAALVILTPIFLLLPMAGCGGGVGAAPDFSGQEKLGYIVKSAPMSRVMITTVAGGAGESYLEWPGFGERFSFSNDGRFFTIVLTSGRESGGKGSGRPGQAHSIIAATDGSAAWSLPAGAIRPTFSPDSRAVAFYTMAVSGSPGTSTIGVFDIASGKAATLARGNVLEDPTWVDDNSLVYTEKERGTVFRLDTRAGAAAPLTPTDRRFINYTFPVSVKREKIALTEDGPSYNIWSADLAAGRLTQITNNNRYHYRAGYLPGSDIILFQEQENPSAFDSAELALVSGSGGDFSFVTRNFFFDGLQTVSLASGRIAWQHTEKGVSSIWAGYPDGKDAAMIVDAASGEWVADPNFVPVPGWTAANLLSMSVDTGPAGEAERPVRVLISNPGSQPVKALLRTFPGVEVNLRPAEGSEADESIERIAANASVAGAPSLAWRISLQPGQAREVQLTASVYPTLREPQEATMLLTLDVPGTPPRMYWQNLSEG